MRPSEEAAFTLSLSASELLVMLAASVAYGVWASSCAAIFMFFLALNAVALVSLPKRWGPGVLVFISVLILSCLDIVSTYYVISVSHGVFETNALMRPFLADPKIFVPLKMSINAVSGLAIFSLMVARSRATLARIGAYVGGVGLLGFMMLPPINNILLLSALP